MEIRNFALRVATPLAALVFFVGGAKADVQTSLSFASPSTIQAGGTVIVDFNINFIPLPASVGSAEFIDNQTASQVSSCTIDPNPCTEMQIETTASTLTSVFDELIAGNVPGPPNFYPEDTAGSFQFVLPYPDTGTWGISTAGGTDEEQFSELQCDTAWDAGSVVGSPACSTIETFSFAGTFDPDGMPDLSVTVTPRNADAPEPASLGLLGVSLAGLGLWRRMRRQPSR